MTLTRDNVTAASRIMLPTYVGFFAAIGMNYTLAGDRLEATPALAFAGDLLPLPAWGCMFFAASTVMVVALMMHERPWFRFALWLGIICLGVWAVVFIAAAVLSDASPTAAAWPIFAAIACFATDRSLLAREV